MRRGILAAGTRLAEGVGVERPAHLVEATWSEMRSLLQGWGGPSSDELAHRARQRDEADARDVPVLLGDPPQDPVPVEWLDPAAARTERALRAYLAAMAEDDELVQGEGPVRGQAASPGVYEGTARVVQDADGFGRIGRGDVLVTVATSPAFNTVLPLVGAIVTDLGGVLSHAAIVAREYGIPAVVGCGDATARLSDGAVVRVDGLAGEVTPLER
jgi:pyruvate,water dikinase